MDHSVVQSSYEDPCTPIPGGSYSGFVLAPSGAQGSQIFLLTINTTVPIYRCCGQTGHCQFGMVGVLNALCTSNGNDSPGSLNLFRSKAQQVTSVGPLPSIIRGGQLVLNKFMLYRYGWHDCGFDVL